MTITTTPADAEVRRIDEGDEELVVAALSDAFHDDPVFGWIFPDERDRARALLGFFGVVTPAIARLGSSTVAGGAGVALWVPPGAAMGGEGDDVDSALVAAAGDDADRLMVCLTLLERHHPDEPCWYLNLLGVVRRRQGTGLGAAMLRATLDRCDAEGAPAYLEATSADNCRLYERHGFRAVRELPLPDGPSLVAMWREPSPH